MIVLRQIAGARLGLQSTQLVVHHLRRTIMRQCAVHPPEWLSGHGTDNNASRREGGHMALVPLPHIGREHADGRLLGVAIVLPRDVPRGELSACLGDLLFDEQAWSKPIGLTLGAAGECTLQLDDGAEFRHGLRPETWTGTSLRWATVTPICLDRHPRGEHYWQQVEARIADGCERIGLARPADVVATPSPVFSGVPHAVRMPRITRKADSGLVRHTHAVLLFDRPVRGPVVVGAGRYRGYGLCRALSGGQSSRR